MTWQIWIENIAGILEGRASVEPGPNAVRASNWQGKSSFVAAIETALGVATPLTEDEDRGRVRIETPEQVVEVELVRENGTVHRRGDPYLTDEYDHSRADLFACLDETNELRHAVRAGENLEAVLLRPLEVQNIDERIADLQHEREQVESKLAQAEEAARRVPAVTEKVTRLESDLEALREEHDRAAGDRADGSPVQSTQRELANARSERDRASERVQRLETSVERTESELQETRETLEDIDPDGTADLDARLEEVRSELERRERDLEVLQSVYSATELVLEENRIGLVTDIERELDGDVVTCFTCGGEADRADIEAQLAALGERIASHRSETETRREELATLADRREQIENAQRRTRELESEITRLEERLADRRDRLAEARDRLDRERERVEDLAETVDEAVEELTDLESEIKYREAELQEVRDELGSLEQRADRVERLSAERDSIGDEIERLRNRKDEIRYETREAFDEALADVLARFDTGFETARLTPEFDLVVARDGHEASLDALSDGELELLGFVAALAGHEAFDVDGIVPVMLVDGVGGLDEANLRTLVDYLRDRTEYLVFTAYPEYAGIDGQEIDPADWTIATDRETPVE